MDSSRVSSRKYMSYLNVLRKERKLIQRELPDTRILIKHPLMKSIFTDYEISEIICLESTPSDRAESMVKALELKDVQQYNTFLKVLSQYRPSLAEKLSEYNENFKEQDDQNVQEDAGAMHFNAAGPGPKNHISSLSISAKHFLASHLNEKDTFSQFCFAMDIKDNHMQATRRSGNPTAELLQILSDSPDGTMQRLQKALERIGKMELYDSALQLNDNGLC